MLNLFKKSLNSHEDNFIILDRLGEGLQIPVRFSNKAKHISIRINHNGAELVLPNKNIEAGKRFLLKKEAWVRQKLKNLSQHIPEEEDLIRIFDKPYRLEYIEFSKSKVEIDQNIINIYAKTQRHKAVLIKYLKHLLIEEIIDITSFIREKHNLEFSKIRITNNKTKWGSCNSKGVLSFNWRLVFAPREVVDYLIVHEMSHLVHMNHSKKFWGLVEKIYPDYKSPKLWLKQNGKKLHLYLV